MKYQKHRQGEVCLGCLDRLTMAHSVIQEAYAYAKARHSDLHVSWVYRGPDEQEKARSTGASNAKFGQSKHNLNPAQAMDVFQQDKDGNGIFDPKFCVKLNRELMDAGFRLKWGGEFKAIGDYCHWELE